MANKLPQPVVRDPRHQATDTVKLNIEVRRSAGERRLLGAELIDFSRDGFRLRVPAPLIVNEPVEVLIEDRNTPFSLTISAIAQWQRPESGDNWLTGFKLDRQADWETLGELFLNEILTMDS
jgi:PilZ domain-containing protein